MQSQYKIERHALCQYFVRPCPVSPNYQERLKLELALISHFGFEKVFLQVLDILSLSKGIPHIVRGSAGSSLVCYLLGITHINPVEENISVARFMNRYRTDIPDIDIDFPYNRRDDVIARLSGMYGERLARISNHIRFRESSALREAIREQGYRKFLPKHFDVKALFPQKHAQVLERAKELVGSFRGYSLHCGGVVIFDNPIPQKLLLKKGQLRYDKNQIEEKGLFKIDLLCNRGLAQLFTISEQPLDFYPERDEKTADLFCRGDVLGITFSESPTMKRVVQAIRPRSRRDLALCLALVRPAAASRGRKVLFLKRWQKYRRQTQIVYDDDANTLIRYLTGISEDEADYYRRAFAKGNEETIEEFKERIQHVAGRDKYVEDLRMMREYSFCKAHAISYSYLVWALAYWKARDPKTFWYGALLHSQSMYASWVHIMEAKRAGLTLQTPGPNWKRTEDVLYDPKHTPFLFADGHAEYRKYGYWLSSRFMPGCVAVQKDQHIRIRGLIATYRRYASETSKLTFVTVGSNTGTYWDLVLQGDFRLHEQDFIDVEGEVKSFFNSVYVDVKKIHGFTSLKREYQEQRQRANISVMGSIMNQAHQRA